MVKIQNEQQLYEMGVSKVESAEMSIHFYKWWYEEENFWGQPSVKWEKAITDIINSHITIDLNKKKYKHVYKSYCGKTRAKKTLSPSTTSMKGLHIHDISLISSSYPWITYHFLWLSLPLHPHDSSIDAYAWEPSSAIYLALYLKHHTYKRDKVVKNTFN